MLYKTRLPVSRLSCFIQPSESVFSESGGIIEAGKTAGCVYTLHRLEATAARFESGAESATLNLAEAPFAYLTRMPWVHPLGLRSDPKVITFVPHSSDDPALLRLEIHATACV